MSKPDETKTVDVNTEDQGDFEDLFYGRATEKPVDTQEEENTEDIEESDTETEEEEETSDENSEEQSDDEVDADDNDADDSSATETPKKKGNSFQERINELTAARREAEREAEKWKTIAEERDSQKSKETEPETETQQNNESAAPDPEDTEKYPLGDMDPKYNQDMLDYKLELRLKELDAKHEEEKRREAEEARVTALQTEWNAKLEEASETYDNFRETVESLQDAFEGVDPRHGEFIAQTIMSMEKGPDVLYFLATHPDQTESLVKSNPVNAALALGRLEASFNSGAEEKKPVKKTSKAPRPPSSTNKGNSPRFTVKPDTDDLDAFSNEFYN